jgi:hypothetical protein
MHAEYSVELGREDPALELPWSFDDPATRYHDLKRHPELVSQIPEAANCPELSAFLTRINAARFPLQTAKCDTWFSWELSAEEEIFGAAGKFVSYVDLVFTDDEAGRARRLEFKAHEILTKNLCALLKRVPEIAASVELVVRRCYFHQKSPSDNSEDGFYITTYVSGFGDDEPEARQRWAIAITLLQHALVQASRSL